MKKFIIAVALIGRVALNAQYAIPPNLPTQVSYAFPFIQSQTAIVNITPINIAWTGSAQGTQTIAVPLAQALPIYNGFTTNQTVLAGSASLFSATGTSNTVLTAGNGPVGGAGYSGTWQGLLVQWPTTYVRSNGCSSIPVAPAATTGTATIAATTISNTIVQGEGYDANDGTRVQIGLPVVTQTSPTVVTATFGTSPTSTVTTNVRFCYLEHN